MNGRARETAMTEIDPVAILKRFYSPDSPLCSLVLSHGRAVAEKSLKIAKALKAPTVDMAFLETAAQLHDIGIIHVEAPSLGCNGDQPYVCHGVLGRQMLDDIGLSKHGLVCERHVGAGISVEEIIAQQLPLPVRDMQPVSLEEKIIAYADKFFSKAVSLQQQEKTVTEIVKELKKYGIRQVETFLSWADLFGDTPPTDQRHQK
jgi:uncharacterized protein